MIYLYPWPDIAPTPFGSSWYVVRPGEKTEGHNHYEGETFCIARGRGRVTVDAETVDVGPGDVVFIPPLSHHVLENRSNEELSFLNIYWGDPELLSRRQAELAKEEQSGPQSAVLITATPPTPNGDLHLGHLSGPYLGADIYRRHLALSGVKCRALSGADVHQSYVVAKGEQLGRGARETAEHFGRTMHSTLEKARIALDHYAWPEQSQFHIPRTQEVFRRLWDAGWLVEREAASLHCGPCDRYLFEVWVQGTCPHCGSGTNGNACEECGRPNDCADLIAPRCKACGTTPSMRPTRRIYFRLSAFADRLRTHLASATMNVHLRALCERMLADGLPDICATHFTDWGVEVPVPGFEEQRIYVWFEMAAGYLAATEELSDPSLYEEVWKRGAGEVVQFFGFDNGYFHALLFPAIFFAFDERLAPPKIFVMNEFYRLDGSKFSTSRNHAVWGQEILSRFSADAVRFYLAFDGPEREQSSFNLEQFERTVAEELAGRWQGWLDALDRRIEWRHQRIAPEPGGFTDEQDRFYRDVARLSAEVREAYRASTFSPASAARSLSELVRISRRFGEAEEHWVGVEGRERNARTSVALELAAARAFALSAAPLVPELAERLLAALGDESPPRLEEAPGFLPAGRKIGDLRSVVRTSC